MKKKINPNFICSKLFVDQLAADGVRYVCISPGSRNTPLTAAFASNKKIKCFINIDERSSAFFALGLAKSLDKPVAIVTTSGTAVSELYPSVVEAYKSRIPLIICTADRPAFLRNSGANQTINQKNIFNNHIRWFCEMDLPDVDKKSLLNFRSKANQAFYISFIENRGPVHINFPFQKPLEPDTINSSVDESILRLVTRVKIKIKSNVLTDHSIKIKGIVKDLIAAKKCWIIVGSMDYNSSFLKKLNLIARQTGIPVLVDGVSNLRSTQNENLFSNYNLFLRSKSFLRNNKPELILQFGSTPTSSLLENIFQDFTIPIYTINEFGDRFDSRRKPAKVIKMNPVELCDKLISEIKKMGKLKPVPSQQFKLAETTTEDIKSDFLLKNNLKIEPIVINEIINNLPDKTNVFIGNSLPIRDLDNFISIKRKIKIFYNRGASGIDGITSTALGIASNNLPAVLITGDLSFIHDLNALLIAKKYSIPLTVFIINNNGGAIFNSLPISSHKNLLSDFFVTPQNLELGSIVSSFKLKYVTAKKIGQLRKIARNVHLQKNFRVVEIVTDPVKSQKFRESLYLEVENRINKIQD
jgi:2-succinyl-5-enolpyruvyl-6-hydroxy-3-cyclohexene-1-carboxylate synthase